MSAPPLDYVLRRDGHDWLVERRRVDRQGQWEYARFTGYEARERAEQYQALMRLIAKTFVDDRDGTPR